MTRYARASFIAGILISPVTRTCQRSVQFAADQFFDELARARTNLGLDRVNQLSKRLSALAAAGCEESGFVVTLVMAWSPVRRFNAG
jgi:hypothetical protein